MMCTGSVQDRIVVTGGSGMVGQAVRDWVKGNANAPNWVFLSSKDCNLCDYESTLAKFKELKPTHVLHLAANVGGLFKNMAQKVNMLNDNLLMNMNVLRACHEVGVQRAVCCLSTCIFPDKVPSYPITEDMLHDGPPHFSNDAYAYAKRMLDVACQAYREQYGREYLCVIPCNIYGPYDNFHLEDAHVVPALIHKAYLAKKAGTNLVVKGSGKPLRQFIHSRDMARLCIWALFEYDSMDSVILAPEHGEVAIDDIVRGICGAMGLDYATRVTYDTSGADGQFKKTVSNQRLLDALKRTGHASYDFVTLDTGLPETVHWFLDNIDIARK